MWVSMAMSLAWSAAPPRELTTWVRPDYPDELVACMATVRIDASGKARLGYVQSDGMLLGFHHAHLLTLQHGDDPLPDVQAAARGIMQQGLKSVVQCDGLKDTFEAAVTQWRYTPGKRATEQEVVFRHLPDDPDPLRSWQAAELTSEADVLEANRCFIDASVQANGVVLGSKVTGCDPEVARAVEASVRTWTFDPRRLGWTLTYAGTHPAERPASRKGALIPAWTGLADRAHCEVRFIVSEKGRMALDDAQGCAGRDRALLDRWLDEMRFHKTAAPWALRMVWPAR